MRVLRGRADTIQADSDRTSTMLSRTASSGDPAVRVWRPHRQLTFGRRDVREADYDAAADAATERGFEPVERSVGGRAVAYTGTTVAFATALPLEDIRSGMGDRYERAITAVQRALWKLGVPAQRGEPAESFCPGEYSLQWKGKLVGVAQRVRKGAALVSGVVVVTDREEIVDVLEPVYDALDVPFTPDSVGSIAKAGGRAEVETVIETIEAALVGDADAEILHVED